MVKGNIEGVWLSKNESQIFQSDPQTWRLLPVIPDAAPAQAKGDNLAKDTAMFDLVFDAVARLNREGTEVHKSGRNGLHSLRLAELNGIGRDRLRDVLDALISTGRLGRSDGGLIANISTDNR